VRHGILDGAFDGDGQAVASGVVGSVDVEFHFLGMRECAGREFQLPDAAVFSNKRMGIAVPAVEIADERDGLRGGRPFSDRPLVSGGVEMDAAVVVAARVGGERA